MFSDHNSKINTMKRAISLGLSPLIENYRQEHGHYPQGRSTLGDLREELDIPNEWITTDFLGNPIMYQYPGIHNTDSYDLWSYGYDGVQSDDDIGNWEK